ncbi:MAG: hypothetical protein V4697_03490 [Patescibacteria group bacterium]
MDRESIIKEKFQQLPEDIKAAIKSNDLAAKFDAISERHGLHVDQSGSLQTETLLVMLGIEDSDAYVDNIRKELDISQNEAESIAQDVNQEIFKGIRTSLRTMEETNEEEVVEETPEPITPPSIPTPTPDISSIEKAGQFTLEKPEPIPASVQYNEVPLNREAILKGIESDAEPMMDHLLTAPVVSPQKVEVKVPENLPTVGEANAAPKPPAEKPKPYTADPYRESF